MRKTSDSCCSFFKYHHWTPVNVTTWNSGANRHDNGPGYVSRKILKFRTDNFDPCNKRNFWLMQLMYINGWFPAVYMSCMSQNFRLLHVSNLSVRNFRMFMLMSCIREQCCRISRETCVNPHKWTQVADNTPRYSRVHITPISQTKWLLNSLIIANFFMYTDHGYMSREIWKFITDKFDR